MASVRARHVTNGQQQGVQQEQHQEKQQVDDGSDSGSTTSDEVAFAAGVSSTVAAGAHTPSTATTGPPPAATASSSSRLYTKRKEMWVHRNWFCRLFFNRRFGVHRVLGIVYLVQWFWSLAWYFVDYDAFVASPLVYTLCLSGLGQSLTATYYFSFLPKRQADPGYYSDKSALSYAFVKENIFFAMILAFQWLYYTDRIYSGFFRANALGAIVENIFVFTPYWIRTFFPKTRFRDSLENDRNKSDKNYLFFYIATWITKLFYIWAKHYIGFFMNYLKFLDRVSREQQYHMYLLLIFSCAATTISMFLHTLKFKRYIGPRTAFLTYMASYMATFYTFVRVSSVFMANWQLTALTFGGVLCNFLPRVKGFDWFMAYQIAMLVIVNMQRNGELEAVAGFSI